MSQNRARRAAKAKARRQARARATHERGDHRGRSWEPGGFAVSQSELAQFWWARAAVEHEREGFDSESFRTVLGLPERVVTEAAEQLVLDHLDLLWAHGWQPAELLRQGRLATPSVATARLVGRAIAADHAGRRASTLDPTWIAQVNQLELPEESGRAGWLTRWGAQEGRPARATFEGVLEVLAGLRGLPALEPLMPMPGPPGGRPRPVTRSARAGRRTDPVLDRVRNLLAKAESTTFEAEATAFTAKAQELIIRHAIDLALLQGDAASGSAPVEIRVPVDAPYADVKSFLLQSIAETGRCRAVYMSRLEMSTVVGYPDDVETVDMLYTSLLVQAQHALNEDARGAPAGARTRRASYRSAFLLSFAHRIADRLREVNQTVIDDVEHESGVSVLPVLADRSHAVEGYLAERFGDLEANSVRGGYDGAGWARGQLVADSAQLTFGELSGDAAFR